MNLELWITQVVPSLENHKINLLQVYYYAFLHQGACFHLFRNIMVFHENISEKDIVFSTALHLMSSCRVTGQNAEDEISWMCTRVYKFSPGWVSFLMDKLSAHSLNLVLCSLNGRTCPYKRIHDTGFPFLSHSSLLYSRK